MQAYNDENRLSGVLQVTGDCDTLGDTLKAWQFTHDGDGAKVKQEYTGSSSTLTTCYYGGGSYEVQSDGSTEITRQYYALAGVSAGMREGSTFSWFLTDHLGSVVGVTDADATLISQTRYTPFGEIRSDVGTVTETDYGYTFQRNISGINLLDYRFRSYSAELGRFTSPDSIVPNFNTPQSLNRYSYVNNRPINFKDPSGHMQVEDDGVSCATSLCVSTKIVLDKKLLGNIPEKEKTNKEGLTVTEQALKGDIGSIIKLVTPTHIGLREELTVCPTNATGCLGVGINAVYNNIDKKIAVSMDVPGSIGPGADKKVFPNTKFGIIATVGVLIGWGSSSVSDATSGGSWQAGGFAAAGVGMSASVSSPLSVDRVYGQVPATMYVGIGAGLGFGIGVGYSQTTSNQEIK